MLAVSKKSAELQNAMVCDVCRVHVNIVIRIARGSPTRGPPGCIVRPVATFVKCVYVLYYKSYTRIKAVTYITCCCFSTCGPRTRPQ